VSPPPREARRFLTAWRQAAVPTAFAAAVASVPLWVGWDLTARPEAAAIRLLGAPVACAAIFPATRVWIALVRWTPWLDTPAGFAVAAAGCAVLTLLALAAASVSLVLVLWVLAVFPAVVFMHAYPGIVLGLLLPRLLAAPLRPDRLRRALAAGPPAA